MNRFSKRKPCYLNPEIGNRKKINRDYDYDYLQKSISDYFYDYDYFLFRNCDYVYFSIANRKRNRLGHLMENLMEIFF